MKLIKSKRGKIPIPDNDLLGVTDTMIVQSSHKPESLQLHVDINHSHPEELSIELISPTGTRETVKSPHIGLIVSGHMTFRVLNWASLCEAGTKGEWTLRVIDAGIGDSGYIEGWQLEFDCIPESEILIEDQSTLELHHYESQSGKLASIDLLIEIEHQHVGDLTVKLINPSGLEVVLHDKAGSDGKTLRLALNSYYLSVFNKCEVHGMWRLIVEDALKGDTGKLKNWKIELKSTN